MANTTLPDKTKFAIVMGAMDAGRTVAQACRAAGVSDSTARRWVLERTRFQGLLGPTGPATAEEGVGTALLVREITELKKQLKAAGKEDITAEYVKRKIFGLKEEADTLVIPDWMVKPARSLSAPGVPTLFASDWHWGERVFPTQLEGKNEYNLAIAERRARHLIERAIDLLVNHMVNPDYPGIVFALGGDMVSGGIHEELMATDEEEIMPVVMDVSAILVWCILKLADTFGAVFVPAVTGNHGRSTKKIRAKGRNFTSFDWIIYRIVQFKLQDDKRVTFHIPDGSDALYKVYHHRYLLTHGDQFRGGDGVIGPLGPIIRGDHRKRSRNSQIGMEYDTMLLGHWHSLIQLQRLIVNGSLKGYDEYAYTSNFPFELPRQALWLTHPSRGITFSIPVYVDEQTSRSDSPAWAAVPKAN